MLSIILRTVIMFLVIMLMMRLSGKRQLGQLQIGELAVTILISELAAKPILESDSPLWQSITAIVTLIILEVLFSFISLKWLHFRKFIEGRPSVLIENCKINQKEMRKNRFSVDDLVENLRQNGALSVDDVETAILETNGHLSVFLKNSQSPPTAEDLKIKVPTSPIPYTVISDGRILTMNLNKIGISEKQLFRIMKKQGYTNQKDIFYMSLTEDKDCIIVKKE